MIFYFSGTGNSLYVAKALAGGQEIKNIALCEPSEFIDTEIGFISPVYCGLLPKIVADFINKSKFKSEYIWAVMTCGGGEGNTYKQLQGLLKEKGNALDFATRIVMPDNCIVFKTSQEKRAELLSITEKEVYKIREQINKRERQSISSKYNKLGGNVMWKLLRSVYKIDRREVSSSCNGCGICAKLCPKKCIEIKGGKPNFADGCAYCFACIQWCPKSAISFGKLKVGGTSKYTNPNIQIDEMLARNKDKH
ncbi:MAG: EFR1 family ferrodoxin [Clostridia bacterium]